MPTLTEGKYPGEFIATEANGKRSRENGTLVAGQNLPTARVVGRITASGKYTDLAPAAVDGSQTAAGVLFAAVNATGGDKTAVFMVRDCELNRADLDFGALTAAQITTAISQLASLGVIVRPAV